MLARTRFEADGAPAVRLRHAISAARNEHALGGAMVVAALLGAVSGVSGLLAPLVLAGNGLSAGAIGTAIALSAVLFMASGALSIANPVGARRREAGRSRGAMVGATFLIPFASFSTVAVILFLVVSAGARALLVTVVYALARSQVPREGLAVPIGGLMNVMWAAMALVAPLAAGLALSAGGAKWAFVAIAAAGFAVAAWMLLPKPRAAYA